MNPWRRRLRRLRRWTLATLTGLIILLGLAVALLSQLLPMLESRPQELADWLSERTGMQVQLRAARAEWNGRGIQVDLNGFSLGAESGVYIDRARLQIFALEGLLPGMPLASLQLSEPRIEVERGDDGRWRIRGLGLDSAGETDFGLVDRLGEIVLDRATVHVRDAARGVDWNLDRVDARMRSEGGRVRVGINAYQASGAPLHAVLDLDNRLSDGRIYLQLPESALDPWLSDGVPADWGLPEARLALRAWLHVGGGRLESANFELGLSGQLRTQDDAAVMRAEGSDALPSLALRGQWAGGVDRPWGLRLEEVAQGGGWLSLQREADQSLHLQARDWSLARWLPWLLQHPGIDAQSRAQWMARQPQGRVLGLQLDWLDGLRSVRGALVDVGLAPQGNQPGLSGLDLSIDGDAERIALDVDAPGFVFDWPAGLRETMQPVLRGSLLLWRDDDAERSWCLSALALSLGEPDYQIDAEGDLCFDGGAPRASLLATVASAPITVAKRFWIMHKMPPPAVRWLDQALVDGRLQSGRVLLHGDLADWPFRNRRGRFEAIAELDGVTLNYRDDWPRGEQLRGEARFINDGMDVELAAEVAGIEAQRVSGGIRRFRDALLELHIEGVSTGSALLRFLRDSPLWPKLQAGLEFVRILGPAELALNLQIPLKTDGPPPQVQGTVELRDADLRQAAWGIAFDAARGAVEFSERGVRVDDLQVLHMGRPARFDLAVGSYVDDPGNVTEAHLRGRLDAQALIDTQPELSWLKPYLLGASPWRVDLAVPELGGKVPSLRLRSDLVGTELNLPAPLRKSEAVPMNLDLQLELGTDAKGVDLRLGELMRLRGLLREDAPFTGMAEFGDAGDAQQPPSGIAVVGQVPVLETSGWLAMAVGEGSGNGLIHSIDLRCGELDVLGRPFPETRVLYQARQGTQQVRFEGPHLEGELLIPSAAELLQRGITARFERLHWPVSEEQIGADVGMDPRVVPPLHVHARDLHLGDAVLGDTRLESFPTATGMRIEQFSAASDALELSARGDWFREDGSDRSEFEVEFTAQDLGAMLRALGFAEIVDGGQTLATLQAGWPGPPAAFGLQVASGTLSLSVGKGRIPDVNPGAGRLFGLLSLGQIPRRLALDFSDFFQSGLAFDRIEGSFILERGIARTDDLLINSPAAEIRISGLTHLHEQTYAQTMEVLPRAGSVLPVVGALAAGPAGAAIGAVVQAVLPFKQITRTLYRVEGPWSKPEIDVIERGPAKPATEREPQ